jgi:serine/threonine-protein kinase SIK2
MLVLQPNKRVTIGQIKRHRWMLIEPVETPTTNQFTSDEGSLCGTAACEPNDQILKIMQNLGIDTQRTRQSLKTNSYDHYTAFYLLLLERIKNKDSSMMQQQNNLQKYPSVESQKRRPSSIAEQAMRKIGIGMHQRYIKSSIK